MRYVFAAVITTGLLGTSATAAATPAFTLKPVTRDFHMSQTDFEVVSFSPPSPAAFFANDQTNKIEKGIVGPLGSPLAADGTPMYSSAREAGFYNTVSSSASFANWWHDVPNVNTRVSNVTLPFDDTGGVYTFDDQDFFPIDNLGYGNEGNEHNYHFTMHVHDGFVYQPGQTFSVVGDDDIWVFINHALAIDVGGIHGTLAGSVNLDSLNLTPGQTYDLDVFFTERNRFGSTLTVSTNILIPEPAAMSIVLLPALARAAARRRVAWRPPCSCSTPTSISRGTRCRGTVT